MASTRSAGPTSAESPGANRRSSGDSDGDGVADIGGLHASRELVRRRGPIATVGGAAVVAALGLILLVAPIGVMGVLGYVLIVAAAPLLSITGAPLESSPVVLGAGVVGSGVMWWVVGWWAARRACAGAVVGWREFVRELLPLVVGVVVGAGAALLLAALSLGVL